jgi:hypothetical protein
VEGATNTLAPKFNSLLKHEDFWRVAKDMPLQGAKKGQHLLR